MTDDQTDDTGEDTGSIHTHTHTQQVGHRDPCAVIPLIHRDISHLSQSVRHRALCNLLHAAAATGRRTQCVHKTKGRRSTTGALHDTLRQTAVKCDAKQVTQSDRCEISHEAITVMIKSTIHMCSWSRSLHYRQISLNVIFHV